MVDPELAVDVPEALDPPVRDNAEGARRRVGVELELTELDVQAIADIVHEVVGGRLRAESDYVVHVDTDELGSFRIEADLALLQKIGAERTHDASAPARGAVGRALRDAIAAAAEIVAPMEIVGPPLPYDRLPVFDQIVDRLAAHGGRGTQDGPLTAFGLQLNPELPRLDAGTIFTHLQAYLALAPWLRRFRGIDLSRWMTPFVDRHPESYVRAMLAQREPPTQAALIDEYLLHNPTRNRDLDMLPLFMHLDPARVRAVVSDPLLKSRPTFHYRLPDSRLGDAGWKVTDEWRYWLVVERVAAEPALLRELCDAYLALLDCSPADAVSSLSTVRTAWAEQCVGMLRRAFARFHPASS